jgi:DNA polymerase-3 subunit epsilon
MKAETLGKIKSMCSKSVASNDNGSDLASEILAELEAEEAKKSGRDINSILSKPTVIFDLETTGTDIAKARIIEIGAIRISPDGKVDKVERLVNPGIPIPKEVVELTGITDADVASAPSFRQLAKGIFSFFGGDAETGHAIAGYNVLNFDIPILWEEFYRAGISWDTRGLEVLDGIEIFYKKEPRTLPAASKKYLGREHSKAHRALADCQTCIDVISAQLQEYDDLPGSIPEIAEALGRPKRMDLAGKIIYNDKGVPIWNFGPSIGKPVAADRKLCEWVLGKDFPENTKWIIRHIMDKSFS